MKRPLIVIKDQRQKKAVAFPHGQAADVCQLVPAQLTFWAAFFGCPVKESDQKDETEPAFPAWTKTRPVDGAAQGHFLAEDACFLLNLPDHAGMHILIGLHLAAQAVVFAKMLVSRAGVAVEEQHLLAIWRENIAEGTNNGCVHGSAMIL